MNIGNFEKWILPYMKRKAAAAISQIDGEFSDAFESMQKEMAENHLVLSAEVNEKYEKTLDYVMDIMASLRQTKSYLEEYNE